MWLYVFSFYLCTIEAASICGALVRLIRIHGAARTNCKPSSHKKSPLRQINPIYEKIPIKIPEEMFRPLKFKRLILSPKYVNPKKVNDSSAGEAFNRNLTSLSGEIQTYKITNICKNDAKDDYSLGKNWI
jgi:hypothetical protein